MLFRSWRLVRELADGIGDPAPHGFAFVIILRGELVGRAALSSAALSPYRLSMRLARQMSISGITGNRLHALDRQSFNTKAQIACNRE